MPCGQQKKGVEALAHLLENLFPAIYPPVYQASFVERHNVLETHLTEKPGPNLLPVRAAEQQVLRRLRFLRT
jgi:hypothetical protein